MKLYVARHGETEWNRLNKICGRTDSPLTDIGVKQAEELAWRLKDVHIDYIFASPLSRALYTAAGVAKTHGIEVKVDDRLIEQDYGIYEGRDRRDPGFLNNKRMFAYRYPGGESMMDIACRTYGLIEEIKSKHADSSVLFVCHNGICRVIHSYFEDMTNEQYFEFRQESCGFDVYEA